jgi:hypothetical protein
MQIQSTGGLNKRACQVVHLEAGSAANVKKAIITNQKEYCENKYFGTAAILHLVEGSWNPPHKSQNAIRDMRCTFGCGQWMHHLH